jgi:hypothetical protein
MFSGVIRKKIRENDDFERGFVFGGKPVSLGSKAKSLFMPY